MFHVEKRSGQGGEWDFPRSHTKRTHEDEKAPAEPAFIALVAKNMGLEAGKPERSPCNLGFLPKLPKLRLLMCKMERLTVPPFQAHGPASTR